MAVNEASLLLEKHLTELGLRFEREFTFAKIIGRKWRFDYVIVADRRIEGRDVAIEIEGAIWAKGRHTRGKGYQGDLDKYNHATMMGYRVLRFSTEDVLRGRARAFLKMHLPCVEHGGQARGARI